MDTSWRNKLKVQPHNPNKCLHALIEIRLNGIKPYLHRCPVPKNLAGFSLVEGFPLVSCCIASYAGASVIGHDSWYDNLAIIAERRNLLNASC
jgi:hypothetical protein